MTTTPPKSAPSTGRIFRIILSLAGRRALNRLSIFRTRRSRPGERTGTSRRSPAGKVFFFVFSLVLVVNGVLMSTQLVWRLAAHAEREKAGRVELVDRDTFALVRETAASRDERRADDLRKRLLRAFEQQAWLEKPIGAGIEERTLSLMQSFDERGAAAFRPSRLAGHALLPRTGLWYGGREMLAPLALVALAVSAAVVMLSIGGLNQEVLRVEKTLEWWFAFPIPVRSLFLARVLETTFANPLLWLFGFPLFGTTFWCAGYSWFGLFLALAAISFVGMIAGSARIVAETALPRYLSMRLVSVIQVALLAIGYPLLFFALAGVAPAVVEFIVAAGRNVPDWTLFNPFSLPMWLAFRPEVWLPACGAVAGLATFGAVFVAERMVSDGLIRYPEPLQGGRREKRAGGSRRWLKGLAAKELLLLLRDRTLLVQSLVVPVVMVALQAFLNPALIVAARSNPRDGAAMAFGVGAVVLAMGATRVLAVEVPALWLLASVPRSLDRILSDKASLWGGLASVFAIVVFALIGGTNVEYWLRGIPHLMLAIVGLNLYAFIAAGIGILGTDTLDPEPRRRVQISMIYLFMLLAAMFGYALYTPSDWAKLAQLVLSALLAFALWQKVRDTAPFLLDPAAVPPRRLTVSDGVIAALCFFVGQGVLALLLLRREVSPGIAILVAFAAAGLIVSAATLAIFWRASMPNIVRSLGLGVAPGTGFRAIALGAGIGLAATGVGVAYLRILMHFGPLAELHNEVFELSPNRQNEVLLAIAGMGVFAAPIFEEFIFRGLLYGGFRRSLNPLRAATASALVFALVHPPVAALPVFVLALLNALAYERTRTLLAPIVGHMTYNTILIGFELWPM